MTIPNQQTPDFKHTVLDTNSAKWQYGAIQDLHAKQGQLSWSQSDLPVQPKPAIKQEV